MRTRTLVLLVVSPLLPLSLLGSSLGLGGCNPAITLDSPTGSDSDKETDPDADALNEPDAPVEQLDAAADVQLDAALDVQAPSNMQVDGITCTGVTAQLTPKTAPDGRTWTLDLAGTCGALGVVDVYVVSKDDVAYPQACGGNTHVQMSVGGEGDAGFLAYDTSIAGGSCSITSGPTQADQQIAIQLTATVASGSGKTHTLSYAP